MAFSIKNDQADDLVRALCDLTGETITDAVIHSLQMRLQVVSGRTTDGPGGLEERLREAHNFVEQFRSLPRRATSTTTEEILGYDEHGLLP